MKVSLGSPELAAAAKSGMDPAEVTSAAGRGALITSGGTVAKSGSTYSNSLNGFNNWSTRPTRPLPTLITLVSTPIRLIKAAPAAPRIALIRSSATPERKRTSKTPSRCGGSCESAGAAKHADDIASMTKTIAIDLDMVVTSSACLEGLG